MHLAWAFLFTLVMLNLLGISISVGTILFLIIALRPKLYVFFAALLAAVLMLHDNTWMFLLGIMVGFDLADIDTARSWISHRTLGLGYFIGRLTTHRGFTHSISAVAMLWLCMKLAEVPPMFLYTTTLAYISHIIGDMMYDPGEKGRHSPGVQLLWPLKRRFRFNILYQHPHIARLAALGAPTCILIFSGWQ